MLHLNLQLKDVSDSEEQNDNYTDTEEEAHLP